MIISNWKTPFDLHSLHEQIQRFKGYVNHPIKIITLGYP